MKKITYLILPLALLLVLTGCGNKVDEEAIEKITTGLEKRWDYADQLPKEVTVEELEKAVELELNELVKYDAEEFKDFHLYALYDSYRRSLELIKIKMNGQSANSPIFQNNWKEHMEKRAKILYDLNKDYTLNISDKNKEAFENLLANSSRLVKIEEMEKVISEIKSLTKPKIIIEDNSIAVVYETTSALSNESFIAQKLGFPSVAMDILKVLSDYDYDNIVIVTGNNDLIATSVYFDKNTLTKVDFDKWEDLDSVDAYKFYAMSTAYHIRSGIWEQLDSQTKRFIGSMNKEDFSEFWSAYGYTY
ncbi:hypothetical protein [Metasolibacillus meyeri]|uniref:hypothetical protein n=1 Tax=Metasolibacillus meyeri TaxID=1071052 RepID=UPI000D31008E|nr:hypothetical protein [Metasolibacillus meyeri]